MTTMGQWKRRAREWVPPAGLKLYYRVRYGRSPQTAAPPRGPVFRLSERTVEALFPDAGPISVEIPVCHLGEPHDWVSPLPELVALAAIARQAKVRTVFEVGTYTGMATLVMAMNAPTGCEISTLDLDPTQRAQHGIHPFTLGSAFLETPFRHQIRQLYGDSMTFDYGPFLGRMDLVFIDAVHTYDRVRSDTLNAFKLLRPGGIVVWDDYVWTEQHPECVGVSSSSRSFQARCRAFTSPGLVSPST